ncbi:MAG TPA: response regulator transcription factor [Gemmataceae bacterium]|nr:response regulator transcription factor [Gemmataceae bacterium]
MARILLVEDERKVLRSLERGLQAQGYEVVGATNSDTGFELASTQEFDCLILDRMLPGRDGVDVLSDLRRMGKTVPALLLTARDGVEDRVEGLDAGADDYLVKPFAFAELLARLRVLLRRGSNERETVLRAGDLVLDLLQRRVFRGKTEIVLTPREFDLLACLVKHKNTVVTRDMLGRDVWKEPCHALTNVIDVAINSLRRKLEKKDLRPEWHFLKS